jgi:transcriptional regulator with XRE-family HTH domain
MGSADDLIDRIEKKRNAEGLSIANLAELLGFPKDRVYKWVQGINSPKFSDRQLLEEWINNPKKETATSFQQKLLNTKNTNERNLIPIYDSIAIGGKNEIADMQGGNTVEEVVDAGDWFRDATGAMRIHGDSMNDKYPSGCIVAFKEVLDKELLVPGQDYLIETSEYRVAKRIQKVKGRPAHILACSYNEETDRFGNMIHEPFEIALNKVTRISRILGKVERNESSRIVYNTQK